MSENDEASRVVPTTLLRLVVALSVHTAPRLCASVRMISKSALSLPLVKRYPCTCCRSSSGSAMSSLPLLVSCRPPVACGQVSWCVPSVSGQWPRHVPEPARTRAPARPWRLVLLEEAGGLLVAVPVVLVARLDGLADLRQHELHVRDGLGPLLLGLGVGLLGGTVPLAL